MSSTMTLSTANGKTISSTRSPWKTPNRNGNHVVRATTPSTTTCSTLKTPTTTPSKRLSKAEKLAVRERARVAMTPPGQEEEEMEYQKTHQRASLSMAIAMKAGTSPTLSSFPDSFWVPFLEQEEYDRQQMSRLVEQNQMRRRYQPAAAAAVKSTNIGSMEESSSDYYNYMDDNTPSKSTWVSSVNSGLRCVLTTCLYVASGLFFLSFMDAPYLVRFGKAMAVVGRMVLGLCFWLYDVTTRELLRADLFQELSQNFQKFCEYLMTDGLDDFLDYMTDLQMKLNDLVDRLV